MRRAWPTGMFHLRRPEPAADMVPSLATRDGVVIATSRDVAAVFGKALNHILLDIKALEIASTDH